MRMFPGLAIATCLLAASATFSQNIEVNRQNRTVEVTVTARISTIADLAEVTFGCSTHSPTHDQAYQKNLEIADKVTKALIDAGVPKADIVSGTIELNQTSRDETDSATGKKQRVRQFEAHQTWKVRIAAPDAQRVLDLVVRAGANGIEDVSWDVSNPDQIESKARASALEKARTMALEIATGLGHKLGDPIYASNEAVSITLVTRAGLTSNMISNGRDFSPKLAAKLQLFPEKVEKEATVRVVFALE